MLLGIFFLLTCSRLTIQVDDKKLNFMKILKNTFAFVFVLLNILSFSQVKDTIYYDKKWNKTDRGNHQFYRVLPLKKIGKLSLVIDYHKNGKMQMQGYAYTDNLNKYVGEVYWYDSSGHDTSYSSNQNKTNTTLKYYHHNGSLWKAVPYKNALKEGTFKVYDNQSRPRYVKTYKNGKLLNEMNDYLDKEQGSYSKTNVFISHWLDLDKVAKRIHYSKNGSILKEEVYSQSGRVLKTYKAADFINNKPKNGIYYKAKTNNGFVVGFEKVVHRGFQSKLIEINDIDAINTGYFSFIKTGESDISYRCHLYYNNSIPEKTFKIAPIKWKQVKKSKLLSVKKIKKQSVEELIASISTKQWESVFKRKKEYPKGFVQHKTIFKPFNKSFFVEVALEYTNRRMGGFGSYYVNDDDEKEKWRVDEAKLYTINIIVINKNRPIIVLSDENHIQYFIVPLNDGSFYTNYQKANLVLKKHSVLDRDIVLDMMRDKDARALYGVVNQNNKKYIANEFKEILVNQPYDSIRRVKQFIIAKNAKNIDVYNLRLQKLPLEHVREVYFDRTHLQVLSKNAIFFINSLGEQTQRQKIQYSFCGTVSRTKFLIEDTVKQRPMIKINHGGLAHHLYQKKIILTNLKNKQEITFLHKTKQHYRDGNSRFVEGYVDRTQTLLVKNNHKFGLYSYPQDVKCELENIDKKKAKEIQQVIPDCVVETKAKELLPIEYDNIALREPFIILEKDHRFGIYKDKNGLIYQYLGKVMVNFMRYEKLNGEKGWLDVNNFQHYADE